MTPVERARVICEEGGDNFKDALEAHLLRGYVFSGPSFFLMARAMPRDADAADYWKPWAIGDCNAWFVWVGVGDPLRLLDFAPFEMEWIGWHRCGRNWPENHWVKPSAIRRLLKSGNVPG